MNTKDLPEIEITQPARFIAGVGGVLACWAGSLIADIGFTDTTIRNGTAGLFYWVPSVLIGVVAVHQLPLSSRRLRLIAYVSMLMLPGFVLARWLSHFV